jgi:hypothetical protein
MSKRLVSQMGISPTIVMMPEIESKYVHFLTLRRSVDGAVDFPDKPSPRLPSRQSTRRIAMKMGGDQGTLGSEPIPSSVVTSL